MICYNALKILVGVLVLANSYNKKKKTKTTLVTRMFVIIMVNI